MRANLILFRFTFFSSISISEGKWQQPRINQNEKIFILCSNVDFVRCVYDNDDCAGEGVGGLMMVEGFGCQCRWLLGAMLDDDGCGFGCEQ